MVKKKKFRKVVNHSKIDFVMIFVASIGLIIWLINTFIEATFWCGFWVGLMSVVTLYWISTYLSGREVYYKEV